MKKPAKKKRASKLGRNTKLLFKTETTFGADPSPSPWDPVLKAYGMPSTGPGIYWRPRRHGKTDFAACPAKKNAYADVAKQFDALGYFPERRFYTLPEAKPPAPIAMILRCPECHKRHVDQGEFATKPHHTHACQHCGAVWRPAIVNTVGVQFLPGFKDAS